MCPGTDDAALSERLIDERVRRILASMGGDLLSTYGKSAVNDDGSENVFGRLGGYMLQRFGADSEVSADTTEPSDG